jgi:hypothetical protein
MFEIAEPFPIYNWDVTVVKYAPSTTVKAYPGLLVV